VTARDTLPFLIGEILGGTIGLAAGVLALADGFWPIALIGFGVLVFAIKYSIEMIRGTTWRRHVHDDSGCGNFE